MAILVPTWIVENISIGSVGQRATLVRNCFTQHRADLRMDSVPLRSAQSITSCPWIDSGQIQDLGCVKVSNARDRNLVEQSDFDRSTAHAKPIAKLVTSDL